MSRQSSAISTSFFGHVLNTFTNGRLFSQAEQRPDFKLPASLGGEKELDEKVSPSTSHRPSSSRSSHSGDEEAGGVLPEGQALGQTVSHAPSLLPTVEVPADVKLVDWYGPDDPENPQNWAASKKRLLVGMILFMTFAVYAGSSIYTPSIPEIMTTFNVSLTKGVLGLTLFVFGYATGPLIFSPLSEIPSIGRNYVYIPTIGLFVASNFLAAFAPNYSTLMAGRFFSGFFGSPALATGGASLGDAFSQEQLPFAIALWSAGAVAGPSLGPAMASYAVMNLNWRWSLYLLTIISVVALVTLILFLPETYGPTILHRRAKRLRKLTGDNSYKSQGELDQAGITPAHLLREALWRPIRLCFEPIVAFTSVYLGLIYACFYLWFEAFPIVYSQMHGFNLGASSLPFVGLAVAAVPTVLLYMAYLKWYFNPRFTAKAAKGIIIPEDRLSLALYAAPLIPISLLWFGWTSDPSIHWISPTIAASLLLPGLFLLFQSILTYLPFSYMTVAASVLAANDLIRSVIAGAFPLFGHAFYQGLGVGPACSLLAGLTAVLIIPLYLLKRYGHALRKASKYATDFDQPTQ